MIVALEKAIEVVAKEKEKKSTFDPDSKIAKRDVSPEGRASQKERYDPDKKVEKENKAEKSDNNVNEIPTRNRDLEGKEHPETGIQFERKTVKDANGNDVTGVFPNFDSDFDAQLPDNLCQSSDKEQFSECNRQLKNAIEKDSGLKKKFTAEQLEQIQEGDTPDGYTWHHNEEYGKMQLVNSDVHAKTGHTGGKSVWGGGTENR